MLSVLPCRWPNVRRTAAPRPGCPDRLAAPLDSLVPPPRLLAKTWPRDGPLMEFVAPTARQISSSDCRFQREAGSCPPGLPPPDSATPPGFLNLLTSSSARDPSSLVSCWWRSWAWAFEVFPPSVAVPASHQQQAAGFTAAGPSAGYRALSRTTRSTRYTDSGIRRVRSRSRS
jgi:hypothetical protein